MHRIAYSSLRFLVASGDASTRDRLRTMLHAFGAGSVLQARDGFEALDMFSSMEPDIVFADRDMTLVNGLEMTRLIRLTETTGGISGNPYAPVILLTSALRREDIREATEAGATEYLVKPITTEAVYNAVEGVVLDPRPFIQASSYFGPDRRRGVQEGQAERRRARQASPDLRRIVASPLGPVIEDVYGDHVVVRPPNSLSTKAAIPEGQEVETREAVLARAGAALSGLHAQYRAAMADEVAKLEEARSALATRPAMMSARKALMDAARQTRIRAQDYGFLLAARLAAGLEQTLEAPVLDAGTLGAVDCHVDALRSVVQSVDGGEGDALIDAMVAQLGTLTTHMRPAVGETREAAAR